ncbi:hypothetical protein CSV80_11145 [Sporosarcina sp. P12(2017)]|uniref:hypothetical protein n=1 Tax=unclassified Sporosarcina TaxID=2647733 RepID=UPI000C169DB6|nr:MULTISPECIES: hypothetical protein [unclassified Sporosarcina]PIC57016.1 hypothetical protein CSV81_11545 [Sporosarcina sp. P10]PIC60399.1 hypothetical protein CSV80_11145 [Sporosarcina sp. P12(2017)]
MVLAKTEEVKSMDYAIKLGKEIERVEAAAKAMKAELKAFVDVNGPVDTGDVIWDYNISASWSFNEEGLKELAQNMVLEGVNPWKVLNITASNLKKLGWDDAIVAKMGEKKETRRFSSRKK